MKINFKYRFKKLFIKNKLEKQTPVSFTEFLNSFSQDQYNYLYKNSKRIDTLNNKKIDLRELPFKLIKIDIVQYLQTGKIEKMLTKILQKSKVISKKQDLSGFHNYQLLYFLFYVIDTMHEINKTEVTTLEDIPDIEFQNAGIQELNQFGILNTIDSLAEGKIYRWNEVVKLPYQDVYVKMFKNKIEKNINKRYHQIINSRKKK